MSKKRKKFEKRKERERESRKKVLLRREKTRSEAKKREEVLKNPFGEESKMTVCGDSSCGCVSVDGEKGGTITITSGS
jgi:hypothetical protein